MAPMRDVLAVFNAQFHVTKGNIVEWSLKVDPELSLDGVEFSVLPSGIHAIERDVVYFTVPHNTETLHGVAIFRRLATDEDGQRGARLASLGAIVTPGSKPWRHVDRLKKAFEDSLTSSSPDHKWDTPTAFFNDFHAESSTPLISSLDSSDMDKDELAKLSPLNHLPHLLPILGPLSSTLHKHVLARRRILIYCKPPVEGACVLAWICGALGSPLAHLEGVTPIVSSSEEQDSVSRLIDVEDSTAASSSRKNSGYNGFQVLGCITLNDMDRLKDVGNAGTGWVACTSDAIYLEKADTFDLLIDLTTLKAPAPPPPPPNTSISGAPTLNNRRLRPFFYSSSGGKLALLRWGWSDIKPWTELNRIISLSSFRHEHVHNDGAFCCHTGESLTPGPNSWSQQSGKDKSKLQSTWNDLWIWRIYEDVCLVCAGLFLGAGGTSDHRVTLDGEETPLAHIKPLGNGIQGGKVLTPREIKKAKRASGMSALLGNAGEFAGARSSSVEESGSDTHPSGPSQRGESGKRESLRRTTTALLQTFHAQAQFQESALREIVALRASNVSLTIPSSSSSSATGGDGSSSSATSSSRSRRRLSLPFPGAVSAVNSSSSTGSVSEVVTLQPKDLLSLSLNPWSPFDSRFVEWFADAVGVDLIGGTNLSGVQTKAKVVVKRSWSGLMGAFLPG